MVRDGWPDGPKKTGDPDFLHVALTMFACAAFIKESRMKFANANKVDRKSGEAHDCFVPASCKKHWKQIIFGPGTLERTWGTRPRFFPVLGPVPTTNSGCPGFISEDRTR
jgi:hypothetical protein